MIKKAFQYITFLIINNQYIRSVQFSLFDPLIYSFLVPEEDGELTSTLRTISFSSSWKYMTWPAEPPRRSLPVSGHITIWVIPSRGSSLNGSNKPAWKRRLDWQGYIEYWDESKAGIIFSTEYSGWTSSEVLQYKTPKVHQGITKYPQNRQNYPQSQKIWLIEVGHLENLICRYSHARIPTFPPPPPPPSPTSSQTKVLNSSLQQSTCALCHIKSFTSSCYFQGDSYIRIVQLSVSLLIFPLYF